MLVGFLYKLYDSLIVGDYLLQEKTFNLLTWNLNASDIVERHKYEFRIPHFCLVKSGLIFSTCAHSCGVFFILFDEEIMDAVYARSTEMQRIIVQFKQISFSIPHPVYNVSHSFWKVGGEVECPDTVGKECLSELPSARI